MPLHHLIKRSFGGFALCGLLMVKSSCAIALVAMTRAATVVIALNIIPPELILPMLLTS